MRREVIDKGFLTGKGGAGALCLRVFRERDGHVIEGVLEAPDGYWYPIMEGVPCFLRGDLRPGFEDFRRRHNLPSVGEEKLSGEKEDQRRTASTFSDKWKRFRDYGFAPSHQEFLFEWYCKKFGVANTDDLKEFYRRKRLILEVGPGSGFNSRFMAENTEGYVFAADISDAAQTTFENTGHLPNCHVIQADLMDLPFDDDTFDLVVADGVLHHTPDTRQAVRALYRKTRPGGQFFFYVYRKMGPARQFCDEYIRERFGRLAPESCYKACEALTELGRELSRLNAKITLEKPVEVLGIPAGTHDVQRLMYYNFVKCFWNDAFDYETNNMVNFDWYHPRLAWRHTEQEIKGWLDELGVEEYRFTPANPNGISVLLTKPRE